MTDKRYQVFVSSTYSDLVEERRIVMQALMEIDCIPAAMELFPAADDEQFEFIKKVINDCDYYLLIIGGRYGSVTAEGISYTEKEYDYAIEKGLKVVALLHQSPEDIAYAKSETNPALRERLHAFRERVTTGRLVKFYKTRDELAGLVATSVSRTIKMYPGVGWIRGDRMTNSAALEELNELRKENLALQQEIAATLPPPAPVENLAGLDEKFTMSGSAYNRSNGSSAKHNVSASWREIFAAVFPYLRQHPNSMVLKDVIAVKFFGPKGTIPEIEDQNFQTITLQLEALGLVSSVYSRTTKGGSALFFSATETGKRLGLEERAIRSTATTPNLT